MRGTVAKRLRSGIYGDFSIREPRKYFTTNGRTAFLHPRSRRSRYQAAKQAYKAGRL